MPNRTLVSSVTCPHCWKEFPPSQIRHISEHDGLRGDPVLGEEEPMRFLASRFDARGRAIDPLGAVCSRMACMQCHLELPSVALEIPQMILSIVGAPASGKSVMLAAASFSLRSGLVVDGLDFIDADPTLNDLTIELESSLFRSTSPDVPAMLAKTDVSGRLYRSFRRDDREEIAPKPQIFVVRRDAHSRMLCLYDNAGEHFLPGRDSARAPVTRHLSVSRALVFVVDPTQDQRVIESLGGRAEVEARGGAGSTEQRQDLVLIEAANRVRRLRGLSAGERLPFRIVLALAKADIWGDLLGFPLRARLDEMRSASSVAVPSREVLDEVHRDATAFLGEFMPELLATTRALDPQHRIVPFSGLGGPPTRSDAGERLAIRPRDVRPVWPAAPLVVAMSEAEPGIFPEFARG